MARSDNKDPKLSEVKAVLQRLQGFEAEPDEAAGRKPATAEPWSGRGRGVVAGVLILVTTVGLLSGVYLFARAMGPSPDRPVSTEGSTSRPAGVPRPPSQTQEPVATPSSQQTESPAPEAKSALEGARALMAKGRVRAAREQLIALADKGSPDAAWDLARSYDPNVLAGLPADASPDVNEATRWYRAWYAAAVRDGLVADSVSLERIIGSMRQ
jgi:hypothetical protein